MSFAERLPAEVWATVFDLCMPEEDEEFSDATTPVKEAYRLAKLYLLRLSKVCSYWHAIVMGTPALWRYIIADTTLWGKSGYSESTLLRLVSVSLQRSQNFPLRIQVALEDDTALGQTSGAKLMALLCPHSTRWRSIYLWHNYPSFELLVTIKNRIPLLETVGLSLQNDQWHERVGMDVFGDAPRLAEFTMTGRADTPLPTFPVRQLHVFGFTNLFTDELAEACTLIGQLDGFTGDQCWIRLDVDDPEIDLDHFPSVSSNTSALQLTLTLPSNRNAATLWERPVLGAILGALTLPSLQYLGLINTVKQRSLLWDHAHFLQFSQRSQFRSTLVEFELNRVLITDVELIECLQHMPALTQLVVADCAPENHALVTDLLVTRLTDTGTPAVTPLVPALNFFSISTLFAFSDGAFIDFMNQRAGRAGAAPFEIKIYWLPVRARPQLSQQLLDLGSALEKGGVLLFTASKDPEYDSVWSFAAAQSSWGPNGSAIA
ncbi:F-box domain-containing protein [Mycena indigotica]|uniref:F-box domain-containing protein n=1 Tax=Mycena indigotica TaxID=2126181 RepID=A0A8H6S2R2_9AGAR|nr:F-box domain-containing protein [Mycena indigotica]KAF7290230.1 F-box domain-containing protein [Mycena indigotica]